MTAARRWSRRLLVLGVAALMLALPPALLANVMGFSFDPTEEPLEYWPEAVVRYRVVLWAALVLAGIGAGCCTGAALVMRGESPYPLGAVCATLLGVGLALVALHGALPSIERAQIWSTRPPA